MPRTLILNKPKSGAILLQTCFTCLAYEQRECQTSFISGPLEKLTNYDWVITVALRIHRPVVSHVAT